MVNGFPFYPKDHWTLKTGYFEDPNPAIQVQTLPLEGPRSLGYVISRIANNIPETDIGLDRRQSGPTMIDATETPQNLKYDGRNQIVHRRDV